MILKNVNIVTPYKFIKEGFIKIANGKIIEIGEHTDLDGINLNKQTIIPGFIDQHIHGFNGVDTMDSTVESLNTFAASIARYGTTSFLPTTITQSVDKIKKALRNVANVHKNGTDGAEILGIHLEGPFISEKYAGAQPINHIIEPDIELFKEFQKEANGLIKVVTFSPEKSSTEFKEYLKSEGIVQSIGHSDASFNEVEAAIKSGLCNVTHLYNASNKYHHREPGVINAALHFDELKTELIVDGYHVNKDVVNTTYKIKGKDNIIGITDSMRAGGLSDGEYDLGGHKVIKTGSEAKLLNGVYAGSVISMIDCFKNIIEFTGCSIEEAVRMTSTNSAKQLNVIDRKGTIEIGKDADLVVIDDKLDVVMTLVNGKIIFER